MDARLLASGEYAAGAAIALAVAFPIHALVDSRWDVVVAMVAGSVLGMAIHLLLGVVLGPLIGTFQILIIGSLIGMYGGMAFAMRDVMQAASWTRTCVVAIAFGIAVVWMVRLYDRALGGSAAARGRDA